MDSSLRRTPLERLKTEMKYLLGPIFLPIAFFWKEIFGLSVFAGFDFTHLILPFHNFAREMVYQGKLPEWNPCLFTGFPQLAEGEGGFFYPGNFLMLMPGDQALYLSWTIVLHIILSGCLMYAFLRSRGTSQFTALWLSVFYQFLPGIILRAETTGLFQAAAWLPGFFWAAERALDEGSSGNWRRWLGWLLFAGMQIAFMLLAGSSQIAFYAMVGLVFYYGGAIISGEHPGVRLKIGILTYLLIAAFGAGLAAVQLLPTSILASLSYRVQGADIGYYRIGTWLNFPRLASLFIFPAIKTPDETLDYVSSLGYVGFFMIILIGITLNLHKRYMNPILAPFFLGFFGILLSFGLNFIAYENLITFPGFNLFRAMGRMILPAQIALFALAAPGLDALAAYVRNERKASDLHQGVIAGSGIAVILSLWFYFYSGFPLTELQIIGLAFSGTSFVLTLGWCFLFLRYRNALLLKGFLFLWLIGSFAVLMPLRSVFTIGRDAFDRIRDKINVIKSELDYNQPHPPRVLIAIESDIWTSLFENQMRSHSGLHENLPIPANGNELTLGNIGVLNAYTPLITMRMYELMHEYAASGLVHVATASRRLKNVLQTSCANAIIVPPSFSSDDDIAETDINLDGLFPNGWRVLKLVDSGSFVSIPQEVYWVIQPDWQVYKEWTGDPDYLPGKRSAIEVTVTGDDDPIWSMDWKPRFNSADTGDELDQIVPYTMKLPDNSNCRILSVERSNSHIRVEVNADHLCWLVIRESYMPGWKAILDGAYDASIFVADYIFMAVPVPEGRHTIEMSYSTPGLKEGSVISTLCLLIWCAAFLKISVFRTRKKQSGK